MKKISKKKMSVTFSTVCVSALIVTGTFAWSEMKNVQNEFDKTINISAELRDDFDPKTGNKDVYIENTGNTPLYARMKLNEYMEVYNNVDKQFESIKDPTYAATKNQEGAETIKTIAETQWTTHIGDVDDGQTCTNPTLGDVTFHDFYSWKMGGTTTTTLKESTEEYTTPDAKVMSMQAWKDGGLTQGETWVLDTDGYIYYAKAIAPQTTTGLLLDAVNLIKKPETNFYYGIDAIMEVVSENDVTTMINGGETTSGDTLTKASDDASELLRTIASYIKITEEMNKTTPPARDFDKDGDGYLTESEFNDYKATNPVHPIPPAPGVDSTVIGGTVTIGNIEWIVLSKDETLKQAELLSSKILFTREYHNSTPYPGWNNSDIRTYLNGEYYNNLPTELKDSIVQVTKSTDKAINDKTQVETEDYLYLLSEEEAINLSLEQRKCVNISGSSALWWWLRSPLYDTKSVGIVNRIDGSFHTSYNYPTNHYGGRPALTVKYK